MIESLFYNLKNPHQLIIDKRMIDDENLDEDCILCETLVSVISPGTEIAAYIGEPPLRPVKPYPRLLGYCNVARVMKVGDNVSSVSAGDRVLTGFHHCSHFLADENAILSVIPDGVEDRLAACSYLYHLGYDAVLKSNLKLGSSSVVIGLGALGLTSVAMSYRAGAKVYAISDHPVPKEIAKKFGATHVFSRENFEDLEKILGDRLADVVISTTNSWSDWDLALKIAGRNSFIGVIGFPGRGLNSPMNNPLDSQYFYDKQLKIQAVGAAPEMNDSRQFLKFNQRDNLSFILQDIDRGYLEPESLITDMLSWDSLDEAYKNLISRENSPVTYGLEWKK